MPYPFPGMNPYLEHPALWPDVHNGIIAALRLYLAPLVRPHYYVALEQRVYIAERDMDESARRPDIAIIGRPVDGQEQKATYPGSSAIKVLVPLPEEVRETYLEVREVGTNYVITVVEVLSPTNKRPGYGRELYHDKRMRVLASRTHLVEIDLLRGWEPMPVKGDGSASDYRILISRGNLRPNADLYAFGVRQPIPTFPLPLRPKDEEPMVDIGRLLHELYDGAGYDLRLDYAKEPESPLRPNDTLWADQLLREKGLR